MKLAYWDRARQWHSELVAQGRQVAFLGDYNICHQPIDIADPVGNKDSVGFRPVEREKLGAYLDAGFADCFRRFHPGVPAQYTWWSNRGQAFDNDTGWRIDYHMVTPQLAARVANYTVDRAASYDARWSDHAPVVVDYTA